MAIYADPHKRGYYPVWQSLDHKGFFPGSHLYFVTVTVRPFHLRADLATPNADLPSPRRPGGRK